MRAGAWRAATALAAVAALVVAGCGGGSSDNGTPTPSKSSSKAPRGAKRGGDLKVAYASDVDYLDPRQTYYQYGFFVTYAIQRPLYSYKPDDPKNPQTDLAEKPPPGPRPRPAAALVGRQDGDGEDPLGHQVLAAGQPRRHHQRLALRDGERLHPAGAERLRGRLLGRPPRPEGLPERQGQAHQRHRDAGRHHDHLQARSPARRRVRRLAQPARLGPGARGVREEVRQGQGRHVHLPEPRRLDRAVHGQAVEAGPGARPGAQPELGRVDGLQARLPGLDLDHRGL